MAIFCSYTAVNPVTLKTDWLGLNSPYSMTAESITKVMRIRKIVVY